MRNENLRKNSKVDEMKNIVLLKSVIFFIVGFLSLMLSAHAVPTYMVYQGQVFDPSGMPLEDTSVDFKVSIYAPSGACLLYEENHTGKNMANSGGVFSLEIGSGTTTGSDPGIGLYQAFNAIDSGGVGCYATPGQFDRREVVVEFTTASAGAVTLATQKLDSAPYAMYATSLDGVANAVDGLLAIGHENPTSLVHIKGQSGSVTSAAYLSLQDGDSANGTGGMQSAIKFRDSANSGSGLLGFDNSGNQDFRVTSYIPNGGMKLGVVPEFDTMTLLYNGNVGVGTTNPLSKLSVVENRPSSYATLGVENADLSGASRFCLGNQDCTSSTGGNPEYAAFHYFSTTWAGPTNDVYQPNTLSFITNGTDNSISFAASEHIKFFTEDWWNAGREKMRIMNNGSVGIGTTAPDSTYKLDVAGNMRTRGWFTLSRESITPFDFRPSNDPDVYWRVATTSVVQNGGHFVIENMSKPISQRSQLKINLTTGNIGVGKSAEAFEKFEVNGESLVRNSSSVALNVDPAAVSDPANRLFTTISSAVDHGCRLGYDRNGPIIINLADGTYTESLVNMRCGRIWRIIGNATNPENVILNTSFLFSFNTFIEIFEGFTLNSNQSSNSLAAITLKSYSRVTGLRNFNIDCSAATASAKNAIRLENSSMLVQNGFTVNGCNGGIHLFQNSELTASVGVTNTVELNGIGTGTAIYVSESSNVEINDGKIEIDGYGRGVHVIKNSAYIHSTAQPSSTIENSINEGVFITQNSFASFSNYIISGNNEGVEILGGSTLSLAGNNTVDGNTGSGIIVYESGNLNVAGAGSSANNNGIYGLNCGAGGKANNSQLTFSGNTTSAQNIHATCPTF